MKKEMGGGVVILLGGVLWSTHVVIYACSVMYPAKHRANKKPVHTHYKPEEL